ncbi:MAG: hypothetical protein HWN66_02495 [Candidatus Helarchaeota archaeon]|nr:hypothetical protein [Candidatus Helarchaeota archaeon]
MLEKSLNARGTVLASPVYVLNVTAPKKVFKEDAFLLINHCFRTNTAET